MNHKKLITRWLVRWLVLAVTLLLTLPAQAAPTTQAISELFFSEYIEGTSNNKALEIFNGTGAAVNLAAGGYNIQMYFNGNPSAGLTINLTGTVTNEDVYVLAQSSASATILAQADQTSGASFYNGDDAIVLRKGTTIIDVIGQIGVDPGTEWGSGLTSTADNTLRRQDTILAGDPNGSDPFDPAVEWVGFATDTFDGLGSHTVVASNAPVIASCGSPLTLTEGQSATQNVSASDADGTVVSASLVSVSPPTGDITLDNVTPASGVGGTATATVNVAATLAVGSYTVTIEFSNNDLTPQTGQCTLNVTVAALTTIAEIQGTGQFSPLNGQTVTTRGIVTLIHRNGNAFWIQDLTGDGNPATSEGIFVSDSGPATTPAVGDFVTLTAAVNEQQFGASLPLTRLRNLSSIVVESSGNPLPRPVELKNLPDEVISEGIAFWEPLEGMLVRVKNASVVAPTNNFGEFAVLARQDARSGSGFEPRTNHILLDFNHKTGFLDYNPERIAVDDESLATPLVVRPGDKISDLIGVVDYTFSMYKLQPASFEGVRNRPLPKVPVSERTGPKGNLTITAFNVENLFDLIDDPNKDDQGSTPTPADLETKLTKLALAVRLELNLPDILIAEEVENTAILQELGNRVNAAAGTNYVATSFETSDERGIEVGFLWDDNRVDLLNAFQLNDTIVPGVSDAFGPSSPSPGREPLVGVFNVTGGLNDPPLTIIGNHFKSKSGDDPLYGVNDPPIRITEVQRKAQARVVRDYVNILLNQNPNAWVMVAGDLNDFSFPEPGEGADHPLAILEGGPGEVPLTDLVNFEQKAERFTFVFDGNSQVLDHMLVSPKLRYLVAGQDILHFNASFPAALSSDPSTPLAVADHDALEGRFKVNKAEPALALTVLHNNDGESQLINAPGNPDFGGVARFKTLADNLRAQALQGPGKRAVIMLSSGDNFLAGPQFNASLQKGVPFYDSIALRLVGYDAMAIGNHEFDFGPDVLADFIQGFEGRTNFVSANLDFSQEPRLQALVDKHIIVKNQVIKQTGEFIGIVGATTPLLPAISSPRNVVVDPNVAAVIQAEIDRLQAKKINKIVVISHLQNVNEDLALAPLLRGVDIMIAGGGDELLANPDDLLVPGDVATTTLPYPLYATGADGANIPVVTTAGDYKYIGRLVVIFDKDGRVIAVDELSGPVRVAGGSNPDAVQPDPQVQTQVVDSVQTFVNNLASNVIATSEVALEGRRGPTPPGVRTAETNLGNLMADALRWQANQVAANFGAPSADVALQNGGGIRNNSLIPAGNITELDTFSIAAFANFVSIVPNIPPAQFKEIMENAVSRIPLADGRFAQISGFTLIYDPAGTAQVVDNAGNVLTPGNRVVEIRLDDGTFIVQNGVVVPGAPSVNIATNDFSARGGDQYPFRGAPFTTLGVTYQQALKNYIVNALGGVITAADYPEGGEGRIIQAAQVTNTSLTTTLLAEPTAEPTVESTTEPTPTDTSTSEPTPTETLTPEPTSSPQPPSETDTPTPEPSPSAQPPNETDTPTPEPTPTETPTAQSTAEPSTEPEDTSN